jgi:hypothetical protein
LGETTLLLQGCANHGFTPKRRENGEIAEGYSDYVRNLMKINRLGIANRAHKDCLAQKQHRQRRNGK